MEKIAHQKLLKKSIIKKRENDPEKGFLSKNKCKLIVLTIICLIFFATFAESLHRHHDPDQYRSVEELIESRKFVCEKHFVQTEDGYILGLFRIVNPLIKSKPKLARRSVLINHGLLVSAYESINNSPGGDFNPEIIENSQKYINLIVKHGFNNSNLGFALANLGYDVWLANSRGNYFSRNHTILKPEDPQFWDYSIDDMSKYDLPSTIDYILEITGKENLAYIGHSQGTIIMFGLLSSKSEYSQKVKPFIALSPVALINDLKGFSKYFVNNGPVKKFFHSKDGEFLGKSKSVCNFADHLANLPTKYFLKQLIFSIAGYDHEKLNDTRLPVYMCHAPAGTSFKNMRHLIQMSESKKFQMYDYGENLNPIKYNGSLIVPQYLLSNIDSKNVALIYGANDYISTASNIKALRDELNKTGSLLDDYQVSYQKWNHVDPMWGKDFGTLVLPRIVLLLNKYDHD